ncbi:putative deaminase of polymorphic toxin system [Rahnella sp. BIGb0236]|nr:hypothetical protein A9993_24710 [Rahnella victoriana]TDS97805.1 putative deaminase of polymorphic toxin system [Rahnella sp. BIGb0236]VTQ52633.1 Uncharacterised protein [Campylobacter jejuni]
MFTYAQHQELINCFNHLLEYRTHPIYLKHQLEAQRKGDEHFADNKYLSGNLATCSLMQGDHIVSNGLIAASINFASEMRNAQRNAYFDGNIIPSNIASLIGTGEPSAKLWHEETDKIWVSEPYPNSHFYAVDIRYPGQPDRVHDGERILVNVFQELLDNRHLNFNTVIMITERIPCESCTGIISDFLSKNKNVKMLLAYWFSTGSNATARGFDEFASQLKMNSEVVENIRIQQIIELGENQLNVINRKI